ERLAIARDRRADAAIAENAQRLRAQRRADADLPLAGLERRHLLGKLTRRRENERPGQLGRGVGRRAGMLARRHDDTAARTGGYVDVGIDAALADELELGQAFEQVGLNSRALADEHQAFGVLEPRRQRIGLLDVVVPDRNLVPRELAETGKRAH